MLTFADPLRRAERCFAGREAVVDGDVRLSFGALVERCRRLGGALEGLTAPGDRVAVLGANSHRYLELYCAVPASGRLVVPLNTRHALPEIDYALEDSGARILFTDRPAQELGDVAKRVERVIALDAAYESLLDDARPAELGRGVSEDDVAGLFYTGGTTGAAKGVMLTHRNKIADTLHLGSSVRLGEDDVWQIMGPMFHASGTFNILLCIWLGARQVILPGFEARSALDAMQEEGSTITFGVPTMLSALADAQEARPRDLSRLRLLGFGAAPASTALLRRVHAVMPHVELVSMYGATEMGPMGTTIEHLERFVDHPRARTAGRPIIGVDLRVVDEEDRVLPPGEPGEVIVRGPNVMRGYWNKPEQTAEALRDGWYHSGDVGYLDEDACLFLVDRKKDMIISGGENVYSTEVEEVLYQHPAVAECAVFGVPDARWGESVRAAVVLREGSSVEPAELEAHCRAHLGGYKIPRQIDVHDGPLPRSGAGKILKRELRAPFWADAERQIN